MLGSCYTHLEGKYGCDKSGVTLKTLVVVEIICGIYTKSLRATSKMEN
jgi:hypothetical protein